MNVTVPHKQDVMKCLEAIDEDAKAIGAVNTLVRTEHGYKGYNTDGAGLKRAMDEAGISIAGEKCILIGAGGAGSSLHPCKVRRVRCIYLKPKRGESSGFS